MIGLINRGNMPDTVQQEFENVVARLREIFLTEHNEDGTHVTDTGILNFVPVGLGPVPWPTATAPSGWVLCTGQQLSRLTYKGLFDVIGTSFGAGDGSTTFNVPNMQQRFPLGKAASGTGSTLAGTGGNIDHTHTGPSHVHSGPSHSHTIPNTNSESAHTHGFSATTGTPSSTQTATVGVDGPYAHQTHTHDVSGTTGAGSAHSHSFSANTGNAGTGDTGAAGTGATGTGNPPFLVVNYIIFTGVA